MGGLKEKKHLKRIIIILVASVFFLTLLFVCVNVKRFGLTYYKTIDKIARENNLDTNFIMAVVKTESSFREKIESSKGAVGFMQILPSTAEWVCEINNISYIEDSLTDINYNVDLGCKYYNYLLSKFDFEWAIVAYNAGENNVTDWINKGIDLDDIPFKESKDYLKKVLSNLKYYKSFL